MRRKLIKFLFESRGKLYNYLVHFISYSRRQYFEASSKLIY
jgi:hypothetical protein